MFEDQTVELLPERTTMQQLGNLGRGRYGALNSIHALQSFGSYNQNGNVAIAIALNIGNVNIDGTQVNSATAVAVAGSNVAG